MSARSRSAAAPLSWQNGGGRRPVGAGWRERPGPEATGAAACAAPGKQAPADRGVLGFAVAGWRILGVTADERRLEIRACGALAGGNFDVGSTPSGMIAVAARRPARGANRSAPLLDLADVAHRARRRSSSSARRPQRRRDRPSRCGLHASAPRASMAARRRLSVGVVDQQVDACAPGCRCGCGRPPRRGRSCRPRPPRARRGRC